MTESIDHVLNATQCFVFFVRDMSQQPDRCLQTLLLYNSFNGADKARDATETAQQ